MSAVGRRKQTLPTYSREVPGLDGPQYRHEQESED